MNITIHTKEHNITLYNVSNVTFDSAFRKLTMNCWITEQSDYMSETHYKELCDRMQELNSSCSPGTVVLYDVLTFTISE